MIIHHVFKRNGVWEISYEIRGEWKPMNYPLLDLLEA